MTNRYRFEHVATIKAPAEGELSVHVAYWDASLDRPTDVMWRDGNSYRYLPAHLARQFAAALIEASDAAEQRRPDHLIEEQQP